MSTGNRTTPQLRCMDDVRRFNKRTGHHFFDRDALRFFSSRIGPKLYGGRFFVTSEQFVPSSGEPHPRRYTVRIILSDGSTDDAGGFQQFASGAQARRVARELAELGTLEVRHDPYDEQDAPDPDRFAWRPFAVLRDGTELPIGRRNTRAAAEQLRAWLVNREEA